MSASELVPTTIMTNEYQSKEAAAQQDPVYIQMQETINHLSALIDSQTKTIIELNRELEWFRRNLFGKRSETSRRFDDYDDPNIHQLNLLIP